MGWKPVFMAQMLELIKQSAVPAAVMRSAAKGALSLPAPEMLAILVHLTGNKIFAEEAAMTLAGWEEASLMAALSASDVPSELLEYFWNEKNRRRTLMPALLENPRVSEHRLIEAAGKANRELVNLMLTSRRVHSSRAVLQTLVTNTFLTEAEVQQIREELAAGTAEPADHESEAAHDVWTREHADEIKAEEDKAFELTKSPGEPDELEIPPASEPDSAPGAVATAPQRRPTLPVREKVSTLQKIARMNVAQRLKTAFIGNKEERAILIRDSAKIVQNAVLASPKLSDPEVEMFAAAKHVHENVLREIARNRRFLKNYAVVRNLVGNPRCPLEISLTLIKNLLVYDLKSLRHSKSVPDTVRKVAEKLYKEKMDSRAQQQQRR